METKRIYVVTGGSGEYIALVRAKSQAEALAHVMKVRVASQDDLVKLLGDGNKVEDAGE